MLRKKTERSQLVQEEKAESGHVRMFVIIDFHKSCGILTA